MKYKRIIDLREEKDWTQTEVAKKLNVSQRAYSHYENGTRQIPLEILISLAKLYSVSTDYILGLTDKKKS
ncbi:MAG: helix-turn-helix transcriptional regulator [Erysipelotrichaceae bacterium]|nr:helix-turn-helix transcriptional regulator [Erysipelotrichaceae bacterium]